MINMSMVIDLRIYDNQKTFPKILGMSFLMYMSVQIRKY